ncbi:hypothetical protein MPTK1_8g02430 [Marchantia polymorpha subsp. ruderalis]|uniref:Uncharacterized protein n=1 Tax=Marchantia polymorpha TaxID=3197 RepID=A0A2R6XJ21_MARPO|nr:hypothetical protein MARPO_0012s0040 [Marchantia polymorpha]PTQ46079.1 hypothetical protein MARPO_0012s0040 [Marchantia polymorpha]BBN18431.1 hypothetical protein Mp_8g02430 [Marchantia polymorpha subsp. ruderalis]BBN18432.1 hypothetical protein Mp_8g02430 [Marchantia polymorpha subsp. ruderalis]|eukprot:PTQ46078.1 hypothetical protein MARPO_0012s0040 [Marchantia polymorpha]
MPFNSHSFSGISNRDFVSNQEGNENPTVFSEAIRRDWKVSTQTSVYSPNIQFLGFCMHIKYPLQKLWGCVRIQRGCGANFIKRGKDAESVTTVQGVLVSCVVWQRRRKCPSFSRLCFCGVISPVHKSYLETFHCLVVFSGRSLIVNFKELLLPNIVKNNAYEVVHHLRFHV